MDTTKQIRDALLVIDELTQLIKQGHRFWGDTVIDEEVFFNITMKFRIALPRSIKRAERVLRVAQQNGFENRWEGQLFIFPVVDELEKMVETGKIHLFGKVLVNDRLLLEQLAVTKQALKLDIVVAENVLSDYPDQEERLALLEKVLDDAKAEAASIIEAASLAASQIIAEAQQQSKRLR